VASDLVMCVRVMDYVSDKEMCLGSSTKTAALHLIRKIPVARNSVPVSITSIPVNYKD